MIREDQASDDDVSDSLGQFEQMQVQHHSDKKEVEVVESMEEIPEEI